jgi:hypothetical protein
MQLYQPPRSHTEEGLGVFHQRVGELGELAAYIALDLKTETQPRVAQAQHRFETLAEWHRNLPPPTRLSRLSVANPLSMSWSTKRSLLQLHILFLGLFIEPYRNYLVDLGKSRTGDVTIESEKLEAMKAIEEQCVLAARQSARVASLLQIDNLLRSRCWISVYVNHISRGSINSNEVHCVQVYLVHWLRHTAAERFTEITYALWRGKQSRFTLRIVTLRCPLLMQLRKQDDEKAVYDPSGDLQ